MSAAGLAAAVPGRWSWAFLPSAGVGGQDLGDPETRRTRSLRRKADRQQPRRERSRTTTDFYTLPPIFIREAIVTPRPAAFTFCLHCLYCRGLVRAVYFGRFRPRRDRSRESTRGRGAARGPRRGLRAARAESDPHESGPALRFRYRLRRRRPHQSPRPVQHRSGRGHAPAGRVARTHLRPAGVAADRGRAGRRQSGGRPISGSNSSSCSGRAIRSTRF